MRLTYLSALLFIIIFSFSCKRSSPVEAVPENRASEPCGEAVQANAPDIDTAPTDPFIITDASITGDCLTVTLGSSACAGPAIKYYMRLRSGSLSTQHLLKIALQYGSDYSMPGSNLYLISPDKTKEQNKISVNISGSAGYYKTLTYSY